MTAVPLARHSHRGPWAPMRDHAGARPHVVALSLTMVCALLAGSVSAPVLSAQRAGLRSAGVGAAGQDTAPPAGAAQRAMIERQFTRRLNAILRERLALSDAQFDQLRVAVARLESDRRALRRDEWQARSTLRAALLAAEAANEGRVAELLDRLLQLERQRVALMEREQRELSGFLAPSQRARYMALQDELRRNMQELQQRRLAGPPSTPPAGTLRRRPPR